MNDGDAKIKKIKFQKKFLERQPNFPRFNIEGGYGYYTHL